MTEAHGELRMRSRSTFVRGVQVHARALGIAFLLAFIYFLAGKIGLSMAIPPGVATPVWPPSGIALASVLLLGPRSWPGIWLGSFALNWTLLAGLSPSGAASSLVFAAGIATGSTVQPLFGAWLLRRAIGSRDPLARTGDVLRFAGLAGALGCTLSASVGVATLYLGGWAEAGQFGPNWVTWWLGDSVGVLILTPLLLSWNHRAALDRPHRWLELALCFALMLSVGTLLFSTPPARLPSPWGTPYLLLLFLLWAAFRFGAQEAMAALVVIAALAVWGTVRHTGPFALESSDDARLLLETFLGVAALTTLCVGAGMNERRVAESQLRRAHVELEALERDRTLELTRANAALTAEVGERKRAELELRQSHRMLEVLDTTQLRYIRDKRPALVFAALLEDLLALTKSAYGFIGRIHGTRDGRTYLRTEAISDVAWNEETRALSAARAPDLEFYNLQTLFGAVITSGEPVLSNHPASDPRGGGLPGDHPPLESFLGLPLHHGEELIGMVGIANRPGGYDDELVDYLRPFLATCASIIGSIRGDEERRQAEAEKLAMERQLQESQKLESLGVLAGGIAHDFNNILTGILGNAELAGRTLPPGAPGQVHLAEVVHSTQRAAELCRQMLAYSGRGRFLIQRLSLNELIDEVLHLLRASVSKKARLELKLAEGPPAVEADRNQMRQVLMNLILNASEALGDEVGSIRISTGVEDLDSASLASMHHAPEARPGCHVFLEVEDTGLGMSSETLARIFEPFFTTKFTGRGMGLSAVLGIVRGHRGALAVRSSPGRGSSFRLLLPCAEGVVDADAPAAASADPYPARGCVLVVDDEPAVRQVCEAMLHSLGYEVLLAVDGQEGLEGFRARAREIVAVLLDLTMPCRGGVETFGELRRLGPGVPVIVMSGYDEEESARRFGRPAPDAFLHKPFLLADLEVRLRALLA